MEFPQKSKNRILKLKIEAHASAIPQSTFLKKIKILS